MRRYDVLKRLNQQWTTFHSHGGSPILSKWMVYFMENPKKKWMRTGGIPISGNRKTRVL
jgi:hypothetical protein